MLTPAESEAVALSLSVAARSVAFNLPVAILVAWLLTRTRFAGRTVFDAFVHLPLVLPPVVVGYLLLLLFGIRGDVGISLGDTPFYMRPSIYMRGVPAMRYQGEESAQLEGELRWQFFGRWSVLGFVGGGVAWNGFEEGADAQGVISGGGGFRYELARRYGIHAGLDVAGSRDTAALYVQVGSAWMRP